MNYKEEILKFEPFNEQEENDKKLMLKFINKFDDVLTRQNEFGHFTASSWVLNKEKNKILMIYHNIYKSWTWTGGHADGEDDLYNVALRELQEETGVKNIKPISKDLFSLEALTVNGHIKRGKYVCAHVHYNLTYLFEVDENEELKIKEDENSGVKWINIENSVDVSNEEKMKVVFRKLNEKLKQKKY